MNARLKAIAYTVLGTLSLFSAITYTSCERDKCKAIVCAFNGVCIGGACKCQDGYEGPQCETVNRNRFLQTWNVSEDGTLSDAAFYPVIINPGPNPAEIRIRNFNNLLTDEVSAYVKGDTMYIPQQTRNDNTVEGKGYIVSEKNNGFYGRMFVKYKMTNNQNVVNDYGFDTASDPSVWNK